MSKTEAEALQRKINRQERYWFAQLYGLYGGYAVEVQHIPCGTRCKLYHVADWEAVKRDHPDC